MKRLLITLLCLCFSGCIIELVEQPRLAPWEAVTADVLDLVRDVLQQN